MAVIELSMVISAIIGMGVEASGEKAKRQEVVIKVLKKVGLQPDTPPSDFEGVYAYTLVEYGIDKPKPILDFFRNEFLRTAFRQSFERRDPSILQLEAENLIEWHEVGNELREMDVDPRMEFARFTAVFNEIVDKTRTPADVRRDLQIGDIHQNVSKLLEMATNAYQSRQSEGQDWDALREKYLKAVRERFQILELRGLAPRLRQGPPELTLSKVYVELPLKLGLDPIMEFKTDETPIGTKILDSSEQPNIGRQREERQVKYKPIERNKEEIARQKTVNLWDVVGLKRAIIIGEPGAGKTTSLRYLALALAGEPGTSADSRYRGFIPIVARLSKFARRLQSEPNLTLATYLCDTLAPDLFATFLKSELENGHCLVLLDGFDEAYEPSAIIECIHDFASAYGDNLIIASSRERAYRIAPLGIGFEPVRIQPMDFQRVDKFIDFYYSASERSKDVVAGTEELKRELKLRPKLAELSKNPLMLTIIVSLHWRAANLPGHPIEVYQAATETLLENWPKYQGRKTLEETLPLRLIIQILMPIAYSILLEGGLIGEDELLDKFANEISKAKLCDENQAYKVAVQWIEFICSRSCLIMDQGVDQQGKRIFGFLHQRLAEYMAAWYLCDRWNDGEEDFVIAHIHQPKWAEVVPLFVAQVGNGGPAAASRLIRFILNLKSPWEDTVRRDHLLAGKCLGEGVLIKAELWSEVLDKLITLLTSNQDELRSDVVEIIKSLRKTEYQSIMVERIYDLLNKEWPSYIEMTLTTALVGLGETQKSYQLISKMLVTNQNRGDDYEMARSIELLLDSRQEEAIDWLLNVARKYDGRGLKINISEDPADTSVLAADQSFTDVEIGRLLPKDRLSAFMTQLLDIVKEQKQHDRVLWVYYQLCETKSDDLLGSAIKSSDQRVRRLAAESIFNERKEESLQILLKASTDIDFNLNATKTLAKWGIKEMALAGIETILKHSIDLDDEIQAALLLLDLKERVRAESILVELLLSKTLSDNQILRVAKALLKTSAREVGLFFIRTMASAINNPLRFRSAITLKEENETENAFNELLDIATAAGETNRVGAIIALQDPVYNDFRDSKQINLNQLAGFVVRDAGNKYSAVKRLLGAGIIPENVPDNQKIPNNLSPSDKLEEGKSERISNDLREIAKAWLESFPEQDKETAYAKLAKVWLLPEDQQNAQAFKDVLNITQLPACILLRIGEQLCIAEESDAGFDILKKVPDLTSSKEDSWSSVAWTLANNGADKLALEAALQLAEIATNFNRRRDAATLIGKYDNVEKSKDLIIKGIDQEIPQHQNWLEGAGTKGYEEALLEVLSTCLPCGSIIL